MSGTTGERRVGSGIWWNGGTWTLRAVPAEGSTLPDTGAPWRRLPGWALVPLAPVVGGAFVVALPVVGVVFLVQALARRLLAGGGAAARHLAATVATPAARPGEAHLTGAPGEAPPGDRPTPEPPPGETPLDEVEAEVRARKAKGPP